MKIENSSGLKKEYVKRTTAEQLILVQYIRAFNVHEIITSMYEFSRDRKHRSKPIIMSRSKLYILIYMILTESSSIDRLSMDELFIEHIT